MELGSQRLKVERATAPSDRTTQIRAQAQVDADANAQDPPPPTPLLASTASEPPPSTMHPLHRDQALSPADPLPTGSYFVNSAPTGLAGGHATDRGWLSAILPALGNLGLVPTRVPVQVPVPAPAPDLDAATIDHAAIAVQLGNDDEPPTAPPRLLRAARSAVWEKKESRTPLLAALEAAKHEFRCVGFVSRRLLLPASRYNPF